MTTIKRHPPPLQDKQRNYQTKTKTKKRKERSNYTVLYTKKEIRKERKREEE